MQKFDVNNKFKRLILNLNLTIKTIITLSLIAYLSLCSAFGSKSSYSNFSLLVEPMVDLMNKVLNTNYLQALSNTSNYINHYKEPQIFLESILFTPTLKLIFDLDTGQDNFINLYIDNYINLYLHRITNRIHDKNKML